MAENLFIKGLSELIFPPRCSICSEMLPPFTGFTFCGGCRDELEWLSEPLCRICGQVFDKALGRNPICGACLRQPPAYNVARSVVRYTSGIQTLIRQIKYTNDLSVLTGISEIVRCFEMSLFADVDIILPVPLHVKRLRQRGWNQSVFLAKLFFPERLHDIKVDWLERKKNTIEQTKLSGKERRANLRSVFAVGEKTDFVDLVVCLVDDVFTTGTTAQECCKVIAAAGAKEIYVLTLARADIVMQK